VLDAMPRRLLLALMAVAVVAAAGVAAGWSLMADGEGPKVRPPVVASPAVPPPFGYRVVYRVEDTGSDPAVSGGAVSTDVLQVRRPAEARLEHRDGPPPGGEVLSSTVVNERFLFSTLPGSESFSLRRVPAPLSQAPSPEALEAAVAAGVAERVVGGVTVAGELCDRYVYRDAGDVPLAPPQPGRHVETCVTPDGLTLREAVTVDGRQVRVAEAVSVDRRPPSTDSTFFSGRDPSRESTGNLRETESRVVEGRPPEKAPVVGVAVPDGFRPFRDVTVNPSKSGASSPLAGFVRSWARGTELVVVEQELVPSPSSPWSGQGQRVDLGGGRSGEVVYRASAVEVRVAIDGRWVRVSSPSPRLALAVAGTLRP
jgi:hypothetical protein